MNVNAAVRCVSESKSPLCEEGGVSTVGPIKNLIIVGPPLPPSAGATTTNTVALFQGDIDVTGLIDPTGCTFLEQTANPGTVAAGDGTIWVRDDTPNVPMFTDDAGTDHVITTSADIASSTWTPIFAIVAGFTAVPSVSPGTVAIFTKVGTTVTCHITVSGGIFTALSAIFTISLPLPATVGPLANGSMIGVTSTSGGEMIIAQLVSISPTLATFVIPPGYPVTLSATIFDSQIIFVYETP